MTTETKTIECDYLVVGAGTSGMSFVDTLLTEDPYATVVMVDRKAGVGGHWLHAYPFVKLHQPSSNYGVNSLRLAKDEFLDSKGREKQNSNDRAMSQEIVEYYQKVAKQFQESGRVKFFFNTQYEQRTNDPQGKKHVLITSKTTDGKTETDMVVVNIKQKLVTCLIDVVTPSLRDGPTFPVHDSVTVKPVNELPEAVSTKKYSNYVVLGAGKTGVDSLTYLLNHGVPKSNITWVRSRKVWYFIRDMVYSRNGRFTWKGKADLFGRLLKETTWQGAWRSWESAGYVGRVDKSDDELPQVFKAPVIDSTELNNLRSLKEQTVDFGRVTSITADSMVFENSKSVRITATDTLFVDCMAEDAYGYETVPADLKIFGTDTITLGPFINWANPSYSAAIIAFLEATVADNDVKNDMMFFSCGENCVARPRSMLCGIYCELKTSKSLQAHPEGGRFILGSRTNEDSPMHHGGLLKFLWAIFGPMQLGKKGDKFLEAVDNGTFEKGTLKADLHKYGNMDRPILKKIPESSLKKKKETSKQTSHTAGSKEETARPIVKPYPPQRVVS